MAPNEQDRRFVTRLRIAGALVVAGLGLQMATLVEAHPYTFLTFSIPGVGLVVAGAFALVWAWRAQ